MANPLLDVLFRNPRASGLQRLQGCVADDIHNGTAGKCVLMSDFFQVQRFIYLGLSEKTLTPDYKAFFCSRHRKVESIILRPLVFLNFSGQGLAAYLENNSN